MHSLDDGGAVKRVAARNNPKQDRSRARQQALLDSAEELVAEAGMDGLRMREVARKAGLPIASLYHYFPSTAAMVRELSVRHLEKLGTLLRARLDTHMPTGKIVEGRGDIVSLIVDDIAAFLADTPSATAIWAGLHSHRDLRALDVADTLRNAAAIKPYLRRLVPKLDDKAAGLMAIVLLQSASSVLLLSSELSADMRRDLLDSMKGFMAAAIARPA